MKKIIALCFLITLTCNYSFSQGKYLVTKTLISQYDSTTNTWTDPKPAVLEKNYDETIIFYKDSIYYAVRDAEFKKLEQKKSVFKFNTDVSYTISMSLIDQIIPQVLDTDTGAQTYYTASIIENGRRYSSDNCVLVKSNTVLAEIQLNSMSGIKDLRNSITKSTILLITILQAPLRNEPYSKWRLQLEICRLPQYVKD